MLGAYRRWANVKATHLVTGAPTLHVSELIVKGLRTAALENTDQLADRIAYARDYAAEIGREKPLEICFTPFELAMTQRQALGPAQLCERFRALGELGVGWLTVSPAGDSQDDYLTQVEAFGRDVISALG